MAVCKYCNKRVGDSDRAATLHRKTCEAYKTRSISAYSSIAKHPSISNLPKLESDEDPNERPSKVRSLD